VSPLVPRWKGREDLGCGCRLFDPSRHEPDDRRRARLGRTCCSSRVTEDEALSSTLKGMISLWDWLFAIAYMAFFIFFGMMKIGYGILADKDSPYAFAPEEMGRFDPRAHLERIASSVTTDK